MAERIVRIGGASGFWGDTAMAAPQLMRSGQIDYLVFDYLAEVTMSIMTGQRARDPQAGYAVDFVQITMRELLPQLRAQRVKVVANAGGVNPLACRDALRKLADELGVTLKIGVVLGDELLAQVESLRGQGITEMFDGSPFPAKPSSIHAYLGAAPIAQALDAGCDVVITGRCVDSAVTLGVLLHEFKWALTDWDKLSQGTLAGHLIECGAQCTGGLFTDWDRVPDWENIGFPILEVSPDGSFVVTKPAGTGGLVEPASVGEQLLYEIGDPRAYLVPDVSCDFTPVRFEQVGENRVRASGARGQPPTATYKVSATYMDGYKNTAILVVGGERAAAKARRTGEAILARTSRMLEQQGLPPYTETRLEVVGAEDMFGASAQSASREVVLKMAVKSRSKESLALFGREYVAPGTSMAPGTTGLVSGRPAPSPVIRLFSFLYDKSKVSVQIDIDGERHDLTSDAASTSAVAARDDATRQAALPDAIRYDVPALTVAPAGEPMVPLIKLAYGRSGDKGDKANVGLIARDPSWLPLILRWVTPERVASHFAHYAPSRVERFDLPGFNAVNFLLHDTLGGGGVTSLRTDNLAKAFAQVLLTLPVPVPQSLADQLA